MSKLRDQIAEYREPTTRMVGLIKNPPDHSTDNGLLFSALYLLQLHDQFDTMADELKEETRWFLDLVESCFERPGLLTRYPVSLGEDGDQQHDDYRAVLAVCRETKKPEAARKILEWGQQHRFCWNTQEPETFDETYFFDRFPGFVAQVMAAAGYSIPLGEKLSYTVGALAALRDDPNECTPVILGWLGTKAMQGTGWVSEAAIYAWKKIQEKRWPGGMHEVLRIYFRDDPDHPLVRFSRADFE